MGHEVESGHEENHVDQQKPVTAQCHFSFCYERLCDVLAAGAHSLALLIGLCFGKADTEDDDQNWRAGCKPEEL